MTDEQFQEYMEFRKMLIWQINAVQQYAQKIRDYLGRISEKNYQTDANREAWAKLANEHPSRPAMFQPDDQDMVVEDMSPAETIRAAAWLINSTRDDQFAKDVASRLQLIANLQNNPDYVNAQDMYS